MGLALLHSPARQAAPATVACSVARPPESGSCWGKRCAGGGASSLTPPQALIKNKANNGRPIDGRLLSKETR